jgi:glycosyltransferase involved in cell wall biosynthesis
MNLLDKMSLGKSGVGIISKNLFDKLPKNLLNKFQIIVDCIDQFVQLDDTKIKIYWAHLTPEQNEEVATIVGSDPRPLANGGWNKFHKIIFISNHQKEEWIKKYKIPRSQCTVIKHAICPIQVEEKSKDKIIIIHQPSPQRGLSLLVDVFEKLSREYENIELKVCSSYKIYNDNNDFLKIFDKMQKDYERSDLYQRLEKNPKINNIGYLPNENFVKLLSSSHIFAYPSIRPETFCLSLLESMSAGCLCVHSNYGCLPETASNWTMMYDYHEDIILHKERFYKEMKNAIKMLNTQKTQEHLRKQKEYVDYLFNWERRIQEWVEFLQSLENLPLKKTKKTLSINY